MHPDRVIADKVDLDEVGGSPLVCLNGETLTPFVSGVVASNQREMGEGYPGLFTNIYMTALEYIKQELSKSYYLSKHHI